MLVLLHLIGNQLGPCAGVEGTVAVGLHQHPGLLSRPLGVALTQHAWRIFGRGSCERNQRNCLVSFGFVWQELDSKAT